MQDKLFSVQEAAKRLNVSIKTLQRWDKKGILVAKRSAGGHRRYTNAQLEDFRTPKQDKLFSVQEAAKRLNVSIKTLQRWDKKKILVAKRSAGGHRRYTQSQIEEFNGQAKVSTSPRREVSQLFSEVEVPKKVKTTHRLPSVLSNLPSGSFLKNHFLLKHASEDSERGPAFAKASAGKPVVASPSKLEERSGVRSPSSRATPPIFKAGVIFGSLFLILSFVSTFVLIKFNIVGDFSEGRKEFAKFIESLPRLPLSEQSLEREDLTFVPPSLVGSVLAAATGGSDLQLNINVPTIFSKSVMIGTTTPDASAILDLQSEDQGFLAPRMTEAQMEAIPTPPAGLFVYNTDTNHYNMYNGTSWEGIFTQIGDSTTGEAFTETGTSGTSLYFYDADGRGQLTIANLTGVRKYTLPDVTGEVSLLGQTISNAELVNSKVTISPGTNITGGGSVELGSSVTITLKDSIDLAGTLDVSGITTLDAALTVAGATTLSSTLAVSGATTLKGNTTLGDATSDTITFTGRVAEGSDLIPIGTTGTNDLGSSALPWDNIYADNIFAATTGTSGYWQRNSQALSPTNISDDVLIGGTATSSALIKLTGTNVAGANNSYFNAGNVGIGTTSPTRKLEISSGFVSGATGGIKIRTTDDGDAAREARITFADEDDDSIAVVGFAGYGNNFAIIQGTDITRHILLGPGGAGGFVGIGTATPTSELYVTRPLSSGVTGKALVTFDQIESQDIFTASASGTTRFVVSNAGNVGIGTALPVTTLDVRGTASVSGALTVDSTATIQTTNMKNLTIGSSGTGGIALAPAGTTALYAMNGGNVGIGTATPTTFKLEIAGHVGPTVGGTYDLGSSSRRWATVYGDTGNFTSVAGTVTGGSTSSSDWLINSDNATADTEDATLTFERGTAATNSQFKWDSTTKQITTNSPSFAISPDTTIAYSGTSALMVDQVQSQDIFTASASAVTKFIIENDGDLIQGTKAAPVNLFSINSGGSTVFNEQSADIDFRIESNDNENMFMIDAGLNAIGIGGAAQGYRRLHVQGNFTSDASSTEAQMQTYSGRLTGASGDTTRLLGSHFQNTVTTQAVAETITDVGQVDFDEPNIVVGAGSSITNAYTVRITGAPTEGGTGNYALWVDSGTSRFDGDTQVQSSTASTSTTTGALVVTGGLGVAGNGYFGGTILNLVRSESGTGITLRVNNTSDTAGSDANLQAIVGGTSGGDPVMDFQVPSGANWRIGVDNSVSDQFVIASTNQFASADQVTITTGGVVSLLDNTASTSTTTGALVVSGGGGFAGAIYTGGAVNVNAQHILATSGEVVFNETSADIDFRIESDADSNALILDAGLHSGVGAHSYGAAAVNGIYFNISPTFSGTSILSVSGTMTETAGAAEAVYINPTINTLAGFTATIAQIDGTLVEAASGNHSRLAGLSISPPTITAGVATVTDAVTLYINAAPSGIGIAGEVTSIWVDAGRTRLDGVLSVYGDAASSIVDVNSTSVVINENSLDVDFRIESDTNANSFIMDAGFFSGVGAFTFGRAIDTGNSAYIHIDPPAHTAVANQSYYKVLINNNGAVTIPTGTAANAVSLLVSEPNLTATGTVTTAASLMINTAPTEGSSNYGLLVGTTEAITAGIALSGAAGTNNQILLVQNTSNAAAASHSIIDVAVGGTTSTGDPQLRLTVPGGLSWYAGVDNDTSRDNFIIGTGTAIGTTNYLTIDGGTGTGSRTVYNFDYSSGSTHQVNTAGQAFYGARFLTAFASYLTTGSPFTSVQTNVYVDPLAVGASGGASTINAAAALYAASAYPNAVNTTLTDGAAVYIGNPGAATGTFTRQSGIYIEAQTRATNNYGVYINTPTGTIAEAVHTEGGIARFNASGDASSDFIVQSDTNANAFIIDAGTFGGVGSVHFGSVASDNPEGNFVVRPPARTAPANTDHTLFMVSGGGGAITIPTGTAALVSTAYFNEPNITATGTVTAASTVYIANAPTEATSNYALWVDAGTSAFGGNIVPDASDGAAIGTTSLMWSDLFLASGGVVNFNAGDVTITHAADQLTFATASSPSSDFAWEFSNPSTTGATSYGMQIRAGESTIPALQVVSQGGSTVLFNVLGGGEVMINDSGNANTTIGLTINQGASDDQILGLKSSDVSTGLTTLPFNDVEVDDFGVFAKQSATSGGFRIQALSTANVTFVAEAFAQTDDATKSTAGVAPHLFQVTRHDGANALGTFTASSNLFAIRQEDSAGALTRWIVDAEGDTWQSGGITTGAANSYINDTTNANMTTGLTINQGAADNEILALKSSDVAHGMTTITETDTYGLIQKYGATAGGMLMHGFAASGSVATSLFAHAPTDDTVKTTLARGTIRLSAVKTNGTGEQAVGTNGNLVTIDNANNTEWLVDAEGDTWQNGGATMTTLTTGGSTTLTGGDTFIGDGFGLVVGHTAQVAGPGSTNELQVLGTALDDAGILIARFSADASAGTLDFIKSRGASLGAQGLISNGDDVGNLRFAVSDANSASDFVSQVASITVQVDGAPGLNDTPGRILFNTTADGAQATTERMRINSSGEVIVGAGTTTDNSNMTIGLTINQGAADDEFFAGKSSDIAHGLTSNGPIAGETDTFFSIRKQSSTIGGALLSSFSEDPAGVRASLDFYAMGGQADTTPTTTATSLVGIHAGEHDGANAMINSPANSLLFGIYGRAAGAEVARFFLDAEGDTWQSGGITATTGAFTTGSGAFTVTAANGGYAATITQNGDGGTAHTLNVVNAVGVAVDPIALNISSTTAGPLTTTGLNINVSGGSVANRAIDVAAGQVRIQTSTASTSTTTGALVVSGGAGFAGRVTAGNFATAPADDTRLFYMLNAASTVGWQFYILAPSSKFVISEDGAGDRLRIIPTTGVVEIPSTTASTSTTTGALVVTGGVGVGGDVWVGGGDLGFSVASDIIIPNDTALALEIQAADGGGPNFRMDTRRTTAGVTGFTFAEQSISIASGASNIWTLANFAETLNYTGTTNVTSLARMASISSFTLASDTATLTVNKATALEVTPAIEGTNVTLTDASAIRVLNTSGSPTNQYGLYVESLTSGGSDYGVYIAGADTNAIWVDSGAVRFDGSVSFGPKQTLTVDSTTPSVSGGSHFITANTTGTLISNFTNGVEGQIIIIQINDSNTDFDCTSNANFECGFADLTGPNPQNTLTWIYDGSVWLLINWMNDDASQAGGDIAELYTSQEQLEPGDIVQADTNYAITVKKSAATYQKEVIGIVSTAPGITLAQGTEGNTYPIALVGRVPTKVNLENGPIVVGDPITSSSTPGVGMKATKAGRVVGMALEAYDGTGSNKIMVFVNPHWGGTEKLLALDGNDRLGLGTTTPSFKLDIADMQIATAAAQIFNTADGVDADGLVIKLGNTSTATVSASNHFISFETSGIGIVGSIQGNGANGVTYATSGVADFAEYFRKDAGQTIPFGSPVCLGQDGLAVPCDSNNNKIIGVASIAPAFLGGENLGDRSIAVGLVGQVRTRVSTANGEIKIGDPLTTSSIPGVAVKATSVGQILGKALEPFGFENTTNTTNTTNSQIGEILVSVNISWYNPSVYISYDGQLAGITQTVSSLEEQLTLQGDALQNQTASSSAQMNYVLENDPLFKDLNDKVSSLQSKLDLLSLQFEQQASTSGLLAFQGDALEAQVLSASDSASLVQNLGDVELNNATISEDLMVLGRTTVTDLGVTGNINAGMLAIHGLLGEINTLSGNLYLQRTGLGGVDFFDGLIVMDAGGNLKVAGTITVKKINIDESITSEKSVGEAIIAAGATEVEVKTSALTTSSHVFVSSDIPTEIGASVKDKETIKIVIKNQNSENIKVNWWIVN